MIVLRVLAWALGAVLAMAFLLGTAFALCFPWVRRRIERSGGVGTPGVGTRKDDEGGGVGGVRVPVHVEEPDPAFDRLGREAASACKRAGVSPRYIPPARARAH